MIVSDQRELLAGEISTSANLESAAAFRTSQPMLVNLSGSYIQNSIALSSILSHGGSRLLTELDSQSFAALKNMPSLFSQGSWLENMQRVLHLEDKKENKTS